MTPPHPMPETTREVEIDRLRELLSIGAGHAAATLGRIAGETIRMRVPRVRPLDRPAPSGGGRTTGVRVELSGAVGGLAAVLLAPESRDRLLDCMVGRRAEGLAAAVRESALREAGNILLSSLASAIADTLHDRVLHTPPVYTSDDAAAALDTAARGRPLAGVRIEAELYDPPGVLRPRLVWIPDRIRARAAETAGAAAV